MKKKIINFLLWIAVPVVTLGKFYCINIGGNNIAIIGTRTGLPAIWDQKYLYKHWWNDQYLSYCERETEIMSYRDFSQNILADDEINTNQ